MHIAGGLPEPEQESSINTLPPSLLFSAANTPSCRLEIQPY